MTRHVFEKASVVALVLGLAGASAAWADETETTADPVQPGGEVTTGTGVAAGKVGPFAKDAYPSEVIFRPLTLPAQMFQITPDYAFLKIGDSNAGVIGLGLSYGITDQLEVGLSSGFAIHPDAEWSKSLGLRAAFLALDTDQLDLAPGIGTVLDFEEGADVFSGISLDATTRFVLNDMIFLRGGSGLVRLGFVDDFSMSLHLNAGVGFQLTPQFEVGVDLNFFNLNVTPSGGSTFIFADYIPLTINALYNVHKMVDALAFLTFPDLENAGDFVMFGVGANIRI